MTCEQKTVEERVSEIAESFKTRVLAAFAEGEVLAVAFFVKTLDDSHTSASVSPRAELNAETILDMATKLARSFAEISDAALLKSPKLAKASLPSGGMVS